MAQSMVTGNPDGLDKVTGRFQIVEPLSPSGLTSTPPGSTDGAGSSSTMIPKPMP